MENISLIINEKVLLDAMLYTVSKSEQFKKSRKTARLIFAAIILLIGAILTFFSRLIGIATFITGGIVFIFFPKYLAFYYQRYFARVLKSKEYTSRLGQLYDISFGEEYIEMKNPQTVIKHSFGNFEYITETSENFFIKLKAGDFLIYPKAQLKDNNSIKTYFKNVCTNLNIAYYEEYDWKWS